jgi:Tol biopolymer transport system component
MHHHLSQRTQNPFRSLRLALVALSALAVAAITLIPARADDVQPAPGSQILFSSDRDSRYGATTQIYVMNPDGSGQINATRHQPRVVASPEWSPDGTRMAFVSFRDGYADIFVMNADGSGQVNLTHDAASDGYPAWSPDGTRIAFMSDRDGNDEIYVMNADGSGQTNITQSPTDDGLPAWSAGPGGTPDGSRIVFVSQRDNAESDWCTDSYVCGGEVYSINPDGGNLTRLTSLGTAIVSVRPSPDGNRIAFTTLNIDTISFQIYVVNADGTSLRLATGATNSFYSDWSPDSSRLVVSMCGCVEDRNFDIYVMDADGGNQIQLTASPARDDSPAWSPDGKRIVFVRDEDDPGVILLGRGNPEITMMNADGSAQTRLTNVAGEDIWPQWSPDGKRIAFVSDRDSTGGATDDLYKINLDGSGLVRLTIAATPRISNQSGVWSPDGKQIAYVSIRDRNADIYVMNADGSGQRRLTLNPGADNQPAWSPDGKKIAFVSVRNDDTDVYVMNADGSGQLNLSASPGYDHAPSWSPDGTRIAFLSPRANPTGYDLEMFVMNADGSNPTRLTTLESFAIGRPIWSPDGTRIAFWGTYIFEPYLFVMNADGSGLTRLAADASRLNDPSWSPDGTRIAYVQSPSGGDGVIYLINADGSDVQQITFSGEDGSPHWSPDGLHIVFETGETNSREVYVIDVTGANLRNISSYSGDDFDPAWSP